MPRKMKPKTSRKTKMEEQNKIQALPTAPKVTGRGLRPDPKFNDLLCSKFINCMMRKGNKATSQVVFYGAMDEIARKVSQPALEVFQLALNNVKPVVEVKSKRV